MASSFSFKIEGLDKLQKSINKLAQDVQDRVEFELEEFCREVNTDQVNATPVDTGMLKKSNTFSKVADLEWQLSNNTEYAPFVEFGTGGFVKVPQGLEDYAMQFYKNGQGKLPPRPFFFEPFLRRREDLVKKIKTALKTIQD